MKIMIPLSGFGKAGGYRVLSNLASEWVEMGHEVTMLVHYSSPPIYFPTKATIIWIDNLGKKTDHKPEHETKGFKLAPILLALMWGIEKYGNDVDIILANQSIMTPFPVWMNRVNAKKFYYVQAYEPECFISIEEPRLFIDKKFFTNLLLWLLSSFSYVLNLNKIVNSPIYLKYKLLRANYYVPPGIDFSVFYPKNQTLNSDWENRVVTLGCIGRQEKWKGTTDVLDAFDMLKQQNYNVRLLVAYGNLPKDRTLAADCHIVVPKNDQELGEFYRSLDIMIAPGTIQLGAAHYPVMEAMACGIPVITTGYLPASEDKNNAWIVPINNPKSIANAVQKIIANDEIRYERILNANKDIQEFSWEAVSEKMLSIFCSELKSR